MNGFKLPKKNSVFIFGLKANRDIALYLLLSSVTTNFLTLAIPIVLLQIYDRVIGKSSYHSLTWLVVGASIAIILDVIIKISRSKLCQLSGSLFELNLSEHMFKSIINGNFRSIQKINPEIFHEAFSVIPKIRDIFSGKCYQILIDLPFSFLFWWVIYMINKPIAYFLFGLYSTYFLLIFILNIFTGKIKKNKIEKEKDRTTFFLELLSTITISKSMGFESRVIRKNDATQKEYSQSSYINGIVEIIPEILGSLFSQLSLFGTIGIGSYYVIRGEITVGTLTACTLIGGKILSPIKNLITFSMKTKEYAILLNKIINVCKIVPERDLNLPRLPYSIEGRISLDNIYYKDNQGHIIENCSLDFPEKQISVIENYDIVMGSIISHLLMGHLPLDKGNIYIDTYNIIKFNEENHHIINYVPSRTSLFSGTILENITLFDPSKNDLAYDCASLVELDRFISDLPQGYETKVDSYSGHLFPISIFTKISLVRALVNHPSVYIFDNIEKSMDIETYNLFHWLIKKFKGIKTIIIITTDPKLIELADVHYFFYDGKMGLVEENKLSF